MARRDERPAGVVEATPGHIADLAAALRSEHRRELGVMPALESLRHSFAASAARCAAVRGGMALFAMGVEPAGLLTGSAMVWMLGREEMDRHPAFIFRVARWGMGEAYRVTGARRLEQWIPRWYETGLRFAERLGFVGRDSGEGVVHVVHEREGAVEWAH